jgi:hypothetical protein
MFRLLTDGVVSMKRDVRIPDEEGEMYPITLCIEESVHSHVVCETLNVNISCKCLFIQNCS